MRNYEVFTTERQLLDRIQELRERGFVNSEFEVYSSHELQDSDYYYDVNKKDGEASFVDKIAAFFTGEDPEDMMFSEYDWDQTTIDQAKMDIDQGKYLLVVKKDGYYQDETNFGYLTDPRYGNVKTEDFSQRPDFNEPTSEEEISPQEDPYLEEDIETVRDTVRKEEVEINDESESGLYDESKPFRK